MLRARPETWAGSRVTAIASLLPAAERERLEQRLAELRQVDRLVREIPAQRPPAPPPTLAALSTTATTERTTP